MKPYRTRRRFDTVEARLVDSVCIALGGIIVRTGRGLVTAATLLGMLAQVVGWLTLACVVLLWHRIDRRDRVVLTAAVRSAGRGAVHGVFALPGLVVAAVVAVMAAANWFLRPLERLLRRSHDAICGEIRRAEARRERVLRGMRQPFCPEPEEDYDDLYTEYGDPVGRAA